MTSRTRLLFIVLVAVALAFGIDYAVRYSQRPPPDMNWQAEMSSSFEGQWATITAADKVTDVVARCKQYPDPPWLHWKLEAVAAACDVLGRRMPLGFSEIRAALLASQMDMLEERFRGFRDESLSGSDPRARGLLERALRPFGAEAEEVGEVAQKWTELAPHSPFALIARGKHYAALGYRARGSDFAYKTPKDNFRRMGELLGKARADFEAALALDGKLVPAYVELIELGKTTSDHELVEHAAHAALKVDPTDEDIYLEWMRASEPRWGGSMEQMRRIADKAKRYLDQNPRLALMMEKPVAYPAYMDPDSRNAQFIVDTLDKALEIAPSANDLEKAGNAAFIARQPERAIWYFSQSWRFSAEPLKLAQRAFALDKLGRRELAKQSLPEVTNVDHWSEEGLIEIARIYRQLEMRDNSESLFKEVLKRNPHSEYAMSSLCNIYLESPRRDDLARPIVARLISEYPNFASGWYYDFMLKFYDHAPKEQWDKSLRNYLALVNRNDPYEQSRIAQAKAYLGK